MLKDRSLSPSPNRCLSHSKGQSDPICDRDEPGRAAGQFHRDKFLWLEQVHSDAELTPLAFMLAYALANLVNEREGFAWPSIAHLAAKCRVTENGIKKVIRRLTERGHLSVEFETGRGRTNRYRWIVKEARAVTADRHEGQESAYRAMAQGTFRLPDEKGVTAVAPVHQKRGNPGSEKGQQAFRKGATPVTPTLIKESNYDLSYRLSSQRNAQSAANAFDAFWRAYPKKVALRDAIGAFTRAIERAPPDEIIRGATRYAAERVGEDPRYTKNPATWLAKACWTDPPPAAFPLSRASPRPLRPVDRSALGQLHDEADVDEVLERIRRQTARRD